MSILITPQQSVQIAGRTIGVGEPCYIIAEAGVNHNGDLSMACRLVDAAKDSGADAVKFQTFRAEALASESAPRAEYQKLTTTSSKSQRDMLKDLELSADEFRSLRTYCSEKCITFLSTPFDEESVELVMSLDVPAIKVSSGDLTNHLLLAKVAEQGKPVILSTGMAYLRDVERALEVLAASGCTEVVLLHCVSSYPAEPKDANLRALQTLRQAFQVPVGFSDHTLGTCVSLAAVALGACMVEKHLTLDRTLPGPDQLSSLEPHDMASMVSDVRSVEASLGTGLKRPVQSEENVRQVARRGLAVKVDVPKGTVITVDHLTAIRPAVGIPADLVELIVGRTAVRRIPIGTILDLSDLS